MYSKEFVCTMLCKYKIANLNSKTSLFCYTLHDDDDINVKQVATGDLTTPTKVP